MYYNYNSSKCQEKNKTGNGCYTILIRKYKEVGKSIRKIMEVSTFVQRMMAFKAVCVKNN